VHRADNLVTFMCRMSSNLGASTSWNPNGLSRPVMGLLYLYKQAVYNAVACNFSLLLSFKTFYLYVIHFSLIEHNLTRFQKYILFPRLLSSINISYEMQLFLGFYFKNSTCFGRLPFPSSGVTLLHRQPLV
jgi:hypothetical protein